MLRSISIAAAAMLLAGTAAMAAMDQGTRTAQANLRKQLESQANLNPTAREIAVKELLPLTANETWQKSVGEQNAKNLPLAAIKDTDTSWNAAEDELPSQRAVVSNPCAQESVKVFRAQPQVRQIFVMDNQGASVCQNEMNKPYWQGEREAWKNAYAGGKGGVVVEPTRFDPTSHANLQDVTLPMLGSNGEVIGAVTFGIVVDQK